MCVFAKKKSQPGYYNKFASVGIIKLNLSHYLNNLYKYRFSFHLEIKSPMSYILPHNMTSK